jgi:hypothetical protein
MVFDSVSSLSVNSELSLTIKASNNTQSEEISSAYTMYIMDKTNHVISEATNDNNINMKL